jgi:superkiller protein 8
VTSADGSTAVSAGFGGEVKVWRFVRGENAAAAVGEWAEAGRVVTASGTGKKGGVGEVWAVALDDVGRYLATSAFDGRICVWDLLGNGGEGFVRVREYETKGSFGMSIDIVSFFPSLAAIRWRVVTES